MIELRGEKIVLHTLERAHCRELWDAYEPPAPVPTEPLNPGLSAEGADKWFEEMQAKQGKEHIYLGIFTPEGRLLGDIQLANIDWRHRTASLGVGIARTADRGQGYGLDATLTLLRYGFAYLDLYRVSATTAEYNFAMQKILEKCHFVQEGRERQAIYCNGHRWDRLLYGLLRDEFKITDENFPNGAGGF
ncbi:MAG TPA: GNAT family protein [Anaerolineae bacterium]|nr:GNAT family protein [Anaerolineae bacterium]HQI87710.1 GNAT family protein [Anaerolineae bacterium]